MLQHLPSLSPPPPLPRLTVASSAPGVSISMFPVSAMASLWLILASVLLVLVDSALAAPAAPAAPPKTAAAPPSTEAPQPLPPPINAVRYDQRQTGNLNVQVDLKDVEIYAIFDDSLFGSLGARWHKLRKSHQKQKHHTTALTIQRISQDYEYDYSQLTERPTSTSPSSTPSSNETSSTKSSNSVGASTSSRPITIFFTRKTTDAVKPPPVQSSPPISSAPSINSSPKILPNNEVAERRSSPSDDNDPHLRSDEPSAAALVSTAPLSTSISSTTRPVVVTTSLKPSVANRRCGAGFHRDGTGRCRRNRRPLRNKHTSTKNGSTKSKSASIPRTLSNTVATSNSASTTVHQERKLPNAEDGQNNQATV